MAPGTMSTVNYVGRQYLNMLVINTKDALTERNGCVLSAMANILETKLKTLVRSKLDHPHYTMILKIPYIIPVMILLGSYLTSFGQQPKKNDALILFEDKVTNEYGYKDSKGDIAIPPGKYLFCYTETFKTHAIVAVAQ